MKLCNLLFYLFSHPALHCVGFTGARLPIGKNGAVKTIENFINNGSNGLIIY